MVLYHPRTELMPGVSELLGPKDAMKFRRICMELALAVGWFQFPYHMRYTFTPFVITMPPWYVSGTLAVELPALPP